MTTKRRPPGLTDGELLRFQDVPTQVFIISLVSAWDPYL